MEGELLWLFYDDVFSSWIPPNHMMVFWTLEESVWREASGRWTRREERKRAREGRHEGTNA